MIFTCRWCRHEFSDDHGDLVLHAVAHGFTEPVLALYDEREEPMPIRTNPYFQEEPWYKSFWASLAGALLGISLAYCILMFLAERGWL